MASRTREKLLDSALQLFMHKGVENTTIGDIANASDKGRRTIYTYFKNKVEIYDAIIERESDSMVRELKSVCSLDATATDKLRAFIRLRISPEHNTTSPYSIIKSLLSMDFGRTPKARKLATEKSEAMLTSIIEEGVENGEFTYEKAEKLKNVVFTLIRALDFMSTDEDLPQPASSFSSDLSDLLVDSIH